MPWLCKPLLKDGEEGRQKHRAGVRSEFMGQSQTQVPQVPMRQVESTVHAQSLNHVQLFVTLWTVTCQAPLSMEFSRQE